jgi:hypothetical protein
MTWSEKKDRTKSGVMSMRYYFHAVSQNETVPDTQGIELTDDEAEHIGSIIEEMRVQEPELFDLAGDWAIEIVDENGHKIARFPVTSTSLSKAIETLVTATRRALKGRG